MSSARWFLAHSKDTEDQIIDAWCATLAQGLASPGWPTSVVAGRDDYLTRARAMGGWTVWVRDVAVGEDWEGAPLFHGVVVPVPDLTRPLVGRATAQIVENFKHVGKHAFAWDGEKFASIQAIDYLPVDSWKDCASLVFTKDTGAT
jgi:hypothetical protein